MKVLSYTLYLIAGVAVTKRAFDRAQIFGEHAGARFSVIPVWRMIP